MDRVSAEMIHLEEEHEFIMAMYGSDKARKQRIEWLEGKVSGEFRVPLVRAPRGRREQQIRMAMDRMALCSVAVLCSCLHPHTWLRS